MIEKLLAINVRTGSLGKMGDHYQPECPKCSCYLHYDAYDVSFCPNCDNK